MKVSFLNCDNKDSLLIQVEDSNYLINSNRNILSQLEKLRVNQIDGILLTKINEEIIESIGQVTMLNFSKKTCVMVNKRNIRDIPKKFNYENKYKLYSINPGLLFNFPDLKVTPISLNQPMNTIDTRTAYLFSPDYSKKETVLCADMMDNYDEGVKGFFKGVERLVFMNNKELNNADSIINMCTEYNPKEVIFYTNTEKNFNQDVGRTNVKISSEPFSFGKIKKFKDVIIGY